MNYAKTLIAAVAVAEVAQARRNAGGENGDCAAVSDFYDQCRALIMTAVQDEVEETENMISSLYGVSNVFNGVTYDTEDCLGCGLVTEMKYQLDNQMGTFDSVTAESFPSCYEILGNQRRPDVPEGCGKVAQKKASENDRARRLAAHIINFNEFLSSDAYLIDNGVAANG